MIGIRGAVRADRNDGVAIREATRRLLVEIRRRNGFEAAQVVSALFTMTPDLDADFPAHAARIMGWTGVPMLGAQETPVSGAPDRMIRVLLHVDAPGPARHVYLGEAAAMRPDLATPVEEAGADEPGGEPYGPLLVCGLGLIGGSIALGLRGSRRFGPVLGWDRDPEARRRALAAGAVAEVSDALEPLLTEARTVLLALPLGAILAWIERHGSTLRPGRVLLDVGSAKREVVRAMDALPPEVEAVGTHPMAGSERRGFGAARPDLFRGAGWAIVASERTGSRARGAAEALVAALGARAVHLDAAAHDRTVAHSSHLPYLAAAALALEAAEAGTLAASLAGPGLRDTTRLAASDPALMADILAANRDEVGRALAAFRRRLEALERGLPAPTGGASEDAAARVLDGARAARVALFGE